MWAGRKVELGETWMHFVVDRGWGVGDFVRGEGGGREGGLGGPGGVRS